jgi:2,5-furandicarboxylate decarboxylase 1
MAVGGLPSRFGPAGNPSFIARGGEQVKDLRSFLAEVEREQGPVCEIERSVSPDRELAAIVRLLEDRGNPITYFHQVAGSALPVVVGVHGTRARIALALGTSVPDAVDAFLDRLARGVAPVSRADGPVKDVRHLADDVDLGALPIPTHAEKDSGPFLTAAVGIARDGESGPINTGIYRMMVLDRNHITVGTGTDLRAIIQEAHAAGRILEFAAVVGHHPAFQVSSQAKIPRSVDSLAIAGAMLGEPLAVVHGDTVSLPVPAAAEIVLEGRFQPGVMSPDGPFGESPRYYESGNGYVLEVTAVTHRHDAIYLDINNVHGEHTCLSCFPAREAQLLSLLRSAYPHVRAVRIPTRTAGMHAHISVNPHRDGEAKQIAMMALGAIPRLKHVVAINTDVDIYDDESVLWALATRFQADRDLFVMPHVSGTTMDPSSYSLHDRWTPGDLRTQMGLDATLPVGVPFRERADHVGPQFADMDIEAVAAPRDPSRATPWRSGAHAPVH